ncbi:MAG: bacterial/archaeal transporter family-2 protein [Thermoleophilaceae bacterium]|jgi:transporter family-2 protein|nr:bacterial/archaeal transporter family-2 protein [Thermoleophilaceae bacterium]
MLALAATLAVGALLALQPPVNAELARRTGDVGAALVSSGITTVVLGVILFAFGDPGSLRGLSGVPVGLLAGGLFGVAILLVTLIAVRHLGAGGVAAAAIASQLTVAAILDATGVLGLERTPLTPLRLLGIAALLVGVALLVTTR